MVTPIEIVVIVLDILAMGVAAGITIISFRAYRRTKSRTYRFAFIGFLHLLAGLASEAILFRIGTFPISLVHTIETLLFLIGFAALYLSLK